MGVLDKIELATTIGDAARWTKNVIFKALPLAVLAGFAVELDQLHTPSLAGVFGSKIGALSDSAELTRVVSAIGLFAAGKTLQGVSNAYLQQAWEHNSFADKGPYAFSRNPFYDADRLIALSALLLMPSPVVFGMFAAIYIGTSIAGRGEEVDRRVRHGNSYRQYQRRTPRFLTGF